MSKNWNPANIISALRIVAAPVVLFLMYLEMWFNGALPHDQLDQVRYPWLTLVAAAFFIMAAISDLFDGYLARKRGEVTTLGKFLDPLADKILVSTVLIMLVKFGWAPAWVAVVILIREFSITGMRSMASAEGVIIAAGPWGKTKTVFQSIALSILLIHYDYYGIPVHYFGLFFLYVALGLTVYSGLDYMHKYYFSEKKEN